MREEIDGVVFECEADISAKEAAAYVARAKEQHPKVCRVEAHIDGDDV